MKGHPKIHLWGLSLSHLKPKGGKINHPLSRVFMSALTHYAAFAYKYPSAYCNSAKSTCKEEKKSL